MNEQSALMILERLMELINREDGIYVLRGVSRSNGSEAEFEVEGELEQVLDDAVQLLCDEGILEE